MAERDLYADLGVKKDATKDEIKKAYRKLARELHPDRNPGNKKAEERFKRVAYANDVLSDERKRALYDEFGEVGLREGFDAEGMRAMRDAQRRGFGGMPGGGGGMPGGGGFEEFFTGGQGRRRAGFGGTLEDLFGGNIDELFGRGAASGFGGRTAAKAPDQESEITISFDEALAGVEKELTIREGGETRSIRVRIPAGAREGAKVRLRGQGARSAGGEAGDLVLTIHVGEHPFFRQEGEDLHIEVPVTLMEAWKGASIKVPTPAGEVALKIPARVQSGAKLRLKGKGAPRRDGSRGDLFARVMVRMPDGGEGDEAVERAIAELEGHYRQEPRAHFKR
jgi:curved DNA-binding protein